MNPVESIRSPGGQARCAFLPVTGTCPRYQLRAVICSHLAFVAISAEGDFRYFDGQDEWIWRPEPGSSQVAARTLALLGATIKNFESNENGTLALTFSNGHRLTMLESSKEYESYDITRPGQTIIV